MPHITPIPRALVARPCCSRKPDRDPERQQPPHPLSQRRLDELEAILEATVARRRERERTKIEQKTAEKVEKP